MSDTEHIRKEYVDKSIKAFQTMRQDLHLEKTAQDILNTRRQAEYDMQYQNWANHSIRVQASYTVLLVILFLILFIAYMFGGSITKQANSLVSNLPGMNNQKVQ